MPDRPARHRLVSDSCPSAHGFAPRFLPTISHPHAVALHFVRCGQLTGGLAPPRSRPCWAHMRKPPIWVAFFEASPGARTPCTNQSDDIYSSAASARWRRSNSCSRASSITSMTFSTSASIVLRSKCPVSGVSGWRLPLSYNPQISLP